MRIAKRVIADLAPTGVLRVAINLGNSLLAKQTAPDTDPFGRSLLRHQVEGVPVADPA